eukprot:TRINITY_DN3079_c0_g1_i1.p1 TRINITY_DN3079_c0_g1~~TRINITY_DN3079_c0_g1_i1.p1  ORF type:complete len:660 (-),score=150.14 TRINITY_DN3079_c0_g1_i1:80-2059(-)
MAAAGRGVAAAGGGQFCGFRLGPIFCSCGGPTAAQGNANGDLHEMLLDKDADENGDGPRAVSVVDSDSEAGGPAANQRGSRPSATAAPRNSTANGGAPAGAFVTGGARAPMPTGGSGGGGARALGANSSPKASSGLMEMKGYRGARRGGAEGRGCICGCICGTVVLLWRLLLSGLVVVAIFGFMYLFELDGRLGRVAQELQDSSCRLADAGAAERDLVPEALRRVDVPYAGVGFSIPAFPLAWSAAAATTCRASVSVRDASGAWPSPRPASVLFFSEQSFFRAGSHALDCGKVVQRYVNKDFDCSYPTGGNDILDVIAAPKSEVSRLSLLFAEAARLGVLFEVFVFSAAAVGVLVALCVFSCLMNVVVWACCGCCGRRVAPEGENGDFLGDLEAPPTRGATNAEITRRSSGTSASRQTFAVKSAGTRSTGLMASLKSFGPLRQAIGSSEDVGSLNDQLWWSTVPPSLYRLEREMPDVRVASRVLKVVCVRKPDNVEDMQLSWFQKYASSGQLTPGTRYLVVVIICGNAMFAALNEVVDDVYEEIIEGDFLQDCLKLLVSPVNLAINLPLKGAKDADTMGKFFGKKNVRFTRRTTHGLDCATLICDLYSVFSLRMTMPRLAFKEGRIVDFHLASYRHRASLASFRIATTGELVRQLKSFM